MQQERIQFTRPEHETLALIQANPSISNREIAAARFVTYSSQGTTMNKLYTKLDFGNATGQNKRHLLNQWLEGRKI